MQTSLIQSIMRRAQEAAAREGVAVTIALVDRGGHLLALLRDPECSYFGIETSRRKALTAAQFKAPTQQLAEIAGRLPQLQTALDRNAEVELLPGGFPVWHAGQLVGGLGISGGNFEQDQTIGTFALTEPV